MKIGVLDIQGSVEEHLGMLGRLKDAEKVYAPRARMETVVVKNVADLEGIDGLVIPGGESTTMSKLMKKFGLFEEIRRRAKKGVVIWGTCAGGILMAKEVIDERGRVNGPRTGQSATLKLIDVSIERNAYGRQLDSFETEVEFAGKKIPAVFIRAPKILRVGDDVEILAKIDDEVVAAREGRFLITTFHPELTGDLSVYRYFLKLID